MWEGHGTSPTSTVRVDDGAEHCCARDGSSLVCWRSLQGIRISSKNLCSEMQLIRAEVCDSFGLLSDQATVVESSLLGPCCRLSRYIELVQVWRSSEVAGYALVKDRRFWNIFGEFLDSSTCRILVMPLCAAQDLDKETFDSSRFS